MSSEEFGAAASQMVEFALFFGMVSGALAVLLGQWLGGLLERVLTPAAGRLVVRIRAAHVAQLRRIDEVAEAVLDEAVRS